MPRKAFIADVTACAQKTIPRISVVARGGDDGDLNFVFSPLSDGPPIELSALALDVSEYPAGNTWMLYARSSDLPKGVEAALEELASYSAGFTVAELLSTISERLQKVLATGSQGNPFNIDGGSDVEMIDDEQEDESEEEEQYSDDYSDLEGGPRTTSTSTYRCSPQNAAKINRRIKEDLRAVRFAGFKLGILSGLKADSSTSVVSISMQASKLGLSEEALQAWDLESSQYIVLLIRYSDGYKSFETSKYSPNIPILWWSHEVPGSIPFHLEPNAFETHPNPISRLY
jgi:ubiquitin-conjugating enzyme E2 Q